MQILKPKWPGCKNIIKDKNIMRHNSNKTNKDTQKKIIQWGWDEPDTKFIRENIEKMEQMPFDGFFFHVHSDKGVNLSWQVWGNTRLTINEFNQSIIDLKETKFHKFTDLFLRVNVTPGDVNWFDDVGWSAVCNNFGVAAQIARNSGIKGLLFDPEAYKGNVWNYANFDQKYTVSEYREKIRQRGQEWIKSINEQFNSIEIFLAYGYSLANKYKSYSLYSAFLDGILDVCSSSTKIIDGFEFSYGYKKLEEFKAAYNTIKVDSLQWTDSKRKYQKHFAAAFGIFMDFTGTKMGWSETDFSKNYFSPLGFENSVKYALSCSEKYVWIYTETPRWWKNEKLPKEYINALINAKNQYKLQENLPK